MVVTDRKFRLIPICPDFHEERFGQSQSRFRLTRIEARAFMLRIALDWPEPDPRHPTYTVDLVAEQIVPEADDFWDESPIFPHEHDQTLERHLGLPLARAQARFNRIWRELVDHSERGYHDIVTRQTSNNHQPTPALPGHGTNGLGLHPPIWSPQGIGVRLGELGQPAAGRPLPALRDLPSGLADRSRDVT